MDPLFQKWKQQYKKVILFFIVVFPLTVFGQIQKRIKVIDANTNKPVKEIYCYILKNNDQWVDVGETNKNGVFNTRLTSIDTAANYQLDISDIRYKPFRADINLFHSKKIKVFLIPDSAFIVKKSHLIYLECSYTSFGNYKPKEPHSIYDLPDSIRVKLVTHLVDRLGPDFYSKLKLSSGEIVDLERLYVVEENAKNYKWTPYSYYLCFTFQDASKGIGLYTAKIVLDKFGNVVEEIQLPDIKNNPSKSNIISLKKAQEIARENNFYDDKTDVSLSYDKKNGSITWCFKQTTYKPDHTLSGKTLFIDAHNGTVLGESGFGGIWCE